MLSCVPLTCLPLKPWQALLSPFFPCKFMFLGVCYITGLWTYPWQCCIAIKPKGLRINPPQLKYSLWLSSRLFKITLTLTSQVCFNDRLQWNMYRAKNNAWHAISDHVYELCHMTLNCVLLSYLPSASSPSTAILKSWFGNCQRAGFPLLFPEWLSEGKENQRHVWPVSLFL